MHKSTTLLGLLAIACTTAIGQQRAVEKAIEKDQYEKHGKAGEDKLNAWFGGNLMNVKPEAEYAFPLSVQQHITTYKNGKPKDETDMRIYINADKQQFAFDGNQMNNSKKKKDEKIVTVYDSKTSSMLIYDLDKKTLLGMNMNAFRSKASQEAAKKAASEAGAVTKSDISCNKTGKTKTILGYNCEEYECKSEKNKSSTHVWVTKDLKLDLSAYKTGSMAAMYNNVAGINGAVLEMNNYDDKGELAMTMTVTDINIKETFKLISADFKKQETPVFNFEP